MIWLRGLTVFFAFAAMAVTLGELAWSMKGHALADTVRWLGRFGLLVYVLVGNLRALEHGKPITWVSPIATLSLGLLLLGYALTQRHDA